MVFWIPKGPALRSIPCCQLPQTWFPGFCEPMDPWLLPCCLGLLAPPFLSTIAQGLCWAFFSSLCPVTLGALLSLHLLLVLKIPQFPTQLVISFLSPLNLFIFFMLTNTYCVPSTVLNALQVLIHFIFIITLQGEYYYPVLQVRKLRSGAVT